jgi:hypothetical protein
MPVHNEMKIDFLRLLQVFGFLVTLQVFILLKSLAGYVLWDAVHIPCIAFSKSYRMFIRVRYVPFKLVTGDFIFTFCYVHNLGYNNLILKYRILSPVSTTHVQFQIPLLRPAIYSNYQFLRCFTITLNYLWTVNGLVGLNYVLKILV